MHKHLFSTLLKDDPDHFGHDSTHPPHPIITRKWASVRDLDDIYAKHGKEHEGKKVLDLAGLGYDKLLGGGQLKGSYSVKIPRYTESAEEKIKKAGGEVLAVD
jgi:large subunit ribosomal protein L15